MDLFDQQPIRPEFLPLSVIRALWKRKITVVVVWAVICGGAAAVILSLPAVYESRAVILIEQQRIPERYVAPTVNEDLNLRLSRISQQILSYDRLLELITENKLYLDQRGEKVTEQVVQGMRDDIRVEEVEGWTDSRSPAFQVTYEGGNPQTVRDVAYRLANLFIEENLKSRSQQAQGTSSFLESKLKEARTDLERQEGLLSKYRLQHSGELPEQENALMADLQRLQSELESIEGSASRTHQNRVMLENQLQSARAAVSMLENLAEDEEETRRKLGLSLGQPAGVSPLDAAEAAYSVLLERYSKNHPDVRRAEAQVERLRALNSGQEGSEAADSDPGKTPHSIRSDQTLMRERERRDSLEVQLQLAIREAGSLDLERKDVLAELARVRNRLSRLPIRQQQLSQVVRDYDISMDNYRSLWDKKVEATLASEMETRSQSEKFTLLELPRVPGTPVRPKRDLLMGAAAVLGLMLSCALGFLLELKQNVLLGEWELPPEVRVLGQIPRIRRHELEQAAENQSRGFVRKALIASSLMLSATVAALGVGVYFGWISF